MLLPTPPHCTDVPSFSLSRVNEVLFSCASVGHVWIFSGGCKAPFSAKIWEMKSNGTKDKVGYGDKCPRPERETTAHSLFHLQITPRSFTKKNPYFWRDDSHNVSIHNFVLWKVRSRPVALDVAIAGLVGWKNSNVKLLVEALFEPFKNGLMWKSATKASI